MRFSDLVQKPMSFFNYKESVWPMPLCEELGRAIPCEATSTHFEIKKRNYNIESCSYSK